MSAYKSTVFFYSDRFTNILCWLSGCLNPCHLSNLLLKLLHVSLCGTGGQQQWLPESFCPHEVNGGLAFCHFCSTLYWFSRNCVVLPSTGAKLSSLQVRSLGLRVCLLRLILHIVPSRIFLVRSLWSRLEKLQ